MKSLIEILTKFNSVLVYIYLAVIILLIYLLIKLALEMLGLSKKVEAINHNVNNTKAEYARVQAIVPRSANAEEVEVGILQTFMSTSFWVLAAKNVYKNRKLLIRIKKWIQKIFKK